jgi:hypothetical protein
VVIVYERHSLERIPLTFPGSYYTIEKGIIFFFVVDCPFVNTGPFPLGVIIYTTMLDSPFGYFASSGIWSHHHLGRLVYRYEELILWWFEGSDINIRC